MIWSTTAINFHIKHDIFAEISICTERYQPTTTTKVYSDIQTFKLTQNRVEKNDTSQYRIDQTRHVRACIYIIFLENGPNSMRSLAFVDVG